MSNRDSKPCVVCGRDIQWRKKWERDWDNVRYCSDACRKRGVSSGDESLEQVILDLLRSREHGKTICPSEAARRAYPDHWQDNMERIRMAGRRLASRDLIVFTQQGRVVDPSRARGPIRFRLR